MSDKYLFTHQYQPGWLKVIYRTKAFYRGQPVADVVQTAWFSSLASMYHYLALWNEQGAKEGEHGRRYQYHLISIYL